ncbi:hypothetical protein [Corynebacterium flavescens]|uniref:HK97 gp10 family phage protein n=1 Tax=Corynebacterium flavescens TaxID=28028 RepID=A0A1L7CNF1_CORFL|nr:hypothetical protein [Corynebacterium flavescens]APT87382.1 hypothetical protein CFLV_09430 [Corynebacterium flavescens]KAA8720466.1 hypothetical protein F4V60_09190 [Corynebacterium flavescens]GEB97774.1 hypothetical protein CFL01nite_12690 [Corynebacterium flavescens]
MTLNLKISQVRNQVINGAAAGVTSAAQVIEAASVALTPLGETGNLRQSAQVIPVSKGSEVTGGVRYDGLPYIRRQHEETTWNHPRGGQAKYLETARNDNAERVAQIIRNHIAGGF